MLLSASDFELNNAYLLTLRGREGEETFIAIVAKIDTTTIRFYKFDTAGGHSDLGEHRYSDIVMATKWFNPISLSEPDLSRVAITDLQQSMRERIHSQLDKLLDVAEMFSCNRIDVTMSFTGPTEPGKWHTLPTLAVKKE